MIKWFKINKQAWTHRMRQLKKKKLPFTDLFEPLLRRIYCHIALSQLFVLSTTVIHLAQLYIKLYAACSCVLRYTIFFCFKLQVCSGRGFSKSQQQDRIIEMHGSLRACRGADGIVFNLFACEGWFIAKYFDVPCVAASPFAVTR